MLQKTINPNINLPSSGHKDQGSGRILLFIKLLTQSFESRDFLSCDVNRFFLLEILLKGSFACIPLRRQISILPSLNALIN